jgi:muramoyltetrapeptide carboxypeptidase
MRTKVVQIIAPSSGSDDFKDTIDCATGFLIERGFVVLVDGEIYSPMPIYANTTNMRLRDLRRAILNPSVDIIWAIRGGYGAAEIAYDCLDIKPSHPKILIGYSDITILHQLFNHFYNIASIHGSCLASLFSGQKENILSVLELLSGAKTEVALTRISRDSTDVIIGELCGGNLCVLTTMLGTKLHPYFKNKIVVLEDIGEPGYKILRHLNHLMHAGSFDEVRAVIFADFVKSDQYLEYALMEFVTRNPEIPIFRASEIGHGEKNTPLVFGGGVESVIQGNRLTTGSIIRDR